MESRIGKNIEICSLSSLFSNLTNLQTGITIQWKGGSIKMEINESDGFTLAELRQLLIKHHKDKLPSDFVFIKEPISIPNGKECEWTISDIIDNENKTVTIEQTR